MISLQYMGPWNEPRRPCIWSVCICVRKKAEALCSVNLSTATVQGPKCSESPADIGTTLLCVDSTSFRKFSTDEGRVLGIATMFSVAVAVTVPRLCRAELALSLLDQLICHRSETMIGIAV